MADNEESWDNNNDIPRPDGFRPPQNIEEWKRAEFAFTVENSKCVNGFSGVSTKAARSDHVHPCNIDTRIPEGIGVPSWLNTDEATRFPWESIRNTFGSWGGWYGRVGAPTVNDGGRLSNMYSLSNHVHSYTFVDTIERPPNSPSMITPLYESVPDGSYVKFGMDIHSGSGRGIVKLDTKDYSIPANDIAKSGYMGRIPFPSRFDHSHPLNCRDLHDSSSTGNAVKDNIQPIDFDPTKSTSGYGASYGTDTFYARTDHVHPLPTGGTGATGVGSDNGTHSNAFTILSPSNDPNTQEQAYYGSGNFSQTWERDSTGNTNGFKINVVCSIGNRGFSNVLFFRTLTFDKYGLCREVSEVKEGVELQ